MGSFLVVQTSIVLHNDAGFGDGKEDFLVQALVSKAAMKSFDESILPWAPRLDIKGLDPGRMAPILNDLGNKFGPIIRAYKRWCAPGLGQIFEDIQHLITGSGHRTPPDSAWRSCPSGWSRGTTQRPDGGSAGRLFVALRDVKR